jgi:uncharacterized protein (DUF983 family)
MSDFSETIQNGFRLKCPACREEPLFQSFFKMAAKCARCGYAYEREDGYFICAIYINMIVTLVTIVVGFNMAEWLIEPLLSSQMLFWGLFAAVFPPLFFRTSRGLWVNIDYFVTGISGSHDPPGRGISKEEK